MYIFKVPCAVSSFLLALTITFIPYWVNFSTTQQPGIGGEVVPHQDNTFLYTDPPSCTGLWLALEDATKTNGCLWAIPGSHKSRFSHQIILFQESSCVYLSFWFVYHLQCFVPDGLKRRMIRDEIDTHFDHPSPTYDLKEFVPLEVKSGDLVVIHGDLIHQRWSYPVILRMLAINCFIFLLICFNFLCQLWKSFSGVKTCTELTCNWYRRMWMVQAKLVSLF